MVLELLAGFQAWATEIIGAWGYLGIFIVSIIGNASIILPLPTVIFVFTFASVLNPLALGIIAGIGSAIGELTAYYAGRGGRKVLEQKYKSWFAMTKKWVKKRGMFIIIIVFAATPLPADVVGLFAGMVRYDVKKFFIANAIGKTIKMTAVALAGYYSLGFFLRLFGL